MEELGIVRGSVLRGSPLSHIPGPLRLRDWGIRLTASQSASHSESPKSPQSLWQIVNRKQGLAGGGNRVLRPHGVSGAIKGPVFTSPTWDNGSDMYHDSSSAVVPATCTDWETETHLPTAHPRCPLSHIGEAGPQHSSGRSPSQGGKRPIAPWFIPCPRSSCTLSEAQHG